MRLAGIALALAMLPALGGCSGFAPVYGNAQTVTSDRVELALGSPTNRVEQIIYQDLALHFTRATGSAPKLTIGASFGAAGLTNNTVTAAHTESQMTVTAAITLVDANGKVLFAGSRAQTADFTNGPQVLANNQAAVDASTRAAHLLADTIRLTILGALAK